MVGFGPIDVVGFGANLVGSFVAGGCSASGTSLGSG
jgi:hypothetical protein